LKDSNSKIDFNKGVKEGRKLYKQNVTSTEALSSNADESTDEKDSAKSTMNVTFVNEQGIQCSLNNKNNTNTNAKAGESCTAKNLSKGKQTRKRKRNCTNERQTDVNSVDNSGKQESKITRKSPRKVACSVSLPLTNIDITKSSNITSRQTIQAQTLRKSPRKAVERTHEVPVESKRTEKSKETKTDSCCTKSIKNSSARKRKQEVSLSEKPVDKSQNNTENTSTSNSQNDKSTLHQQVSCSTEPKRRKKLFSSICIGKEDSEKSDENSQINNSQYGNERINMDVYGVNNNELDSDSDESSDKDLMETALSPDSKDAKFQINDIVWAKYRRGAYWPAQVLYYIYNNYLLEIDHYLNNYDYFYSFIHCCF